MKHVWIALGLLGIALVGCKFQSTPLENSGGWDLDLQEFFYRSESRIPLISAHRGGPYPGYPENCLETFDYISQQVPVLIECDVERAADGTLVLMHDETLDRTTNGNGKVSDHSWDQLQRLRLVDNDGGITNFRIPTLRETLQWARGKAILTIDIKRSVAFEDVVELIVEEHAQKQVVLITYTIGAAKKLHHLNPDLLLSVTVRNQEEFARLEQSGIPLNQVIAFTGTSEPQLTLYRELHHQGIYCILGTLGNLDRRAQARGDHIYEEFVDRGADIIATDRPLEVAKSLSKTYDLEAPFAGPLVTSE